MCWNWNKILRPAIYCRIKVQPTRIILREREKGSSHLILCYANLEDVCWHILCASANLDSYLKSPLFVDSAWTNVISSVGHPLSVWATKMRLQCKYSLALPSPPHVPLFDTCACTKTLGLRGWSHRPLPTPSASISSFYSVKSGGPTPIPQHNLHQFHGRIWTES